MGNRRRLMTSPNMLAFTSNTHPAAGSRRGHSAHHTIG